MLVIDNDNEDEENTELGPFVKDCDTNVTVEEIDYWLHASEVKILFLEENDVE